jgi:hypothetical protein
MPSTKTVDALDMERRRDVARVIQDHLDATGLSVDDLAKQAGAANSSLYYILNLKKNLGASLRDRLISAGVDERSLLRAAGFSAEHDIQDATVLRMSKKIARLPKDRREIVEGVIDGLLEANKKKS